jgi:hypothetical protein
LVQIKHSAINAGKNATKIASMEMGRTKKIAVLWILRKDFAKYAHTFGVATPIIELSKKRSLNKKENAQYNKCCNFTKLGPI